MPNQQLTITDEKAVEQRVYEIAAKREKEDIELAETYKYFISTLTQEEYSAGELNILCDRINKYAAEANDTTTPCFTITLDPTKNFLYRRKSHVPRYDEERLHDERGFFIVSKDIFNNLLSDELYSNYYKKYKARRFMWNRYIHDLAVVYIELSCGLIGIIGDILYTANSSMTQ